MLGTEALANRHAFRNTTLVNLTVRGLGAAVRAAWGLAVPSMLSVSDFGVYSVAKAQAGLLAQGSILGSPQVILRRGVEVGPPGVWAIHTILLLSLTWYVSSRLFGDYHSVAAYLLATAQASQAIAAAFARRHGRFGLAFWAEIAFAVVLILGFAWLALIGAELAGLPRQEWFLGIESAAYGLSTVLLWRGLPANPAAAFWKPHYWSLFREAYSIGGIVLMDVIVWRRVELFFLEAGTGKDAVGVFALGVQLGEMACLPMAAVLEAWYPNFSDIWACRRKEWFSYLRDRKKKFLALYGSSVVFVPPAVLAVLRAPFLEHYQAWVLPVLILATLRVALNYAGFWSTVLYSTGNQLVLYRPILIAAGMTLAGNALFTIRFGLSGAVLTYAVVHTYLALATTAAARRLARTWPQE